MQRSSVVLPLPDGPMTVDHLAPVHVEVDALQHAVVAEGLPERPGCGPPERRRGSAMSLTPGCRRSAPRAGG